MSMKDGGRTTADKMWEALHRRLAAKLQESEPLCAWEPEKLAAVLVLLVRLWLMENAQLMILVGRYKDPALGGKE